MILHVNSSSRFSQSRVQILRNRRARVAGYFTGIVTRDAKAAAAGEYYLDDRSQ